MDIVAATRDFIDWFRSLDPAFAFLLSLPVLVIAAGLAREHWDRRREREREATRSRRPSTHRFES